MEKNLDGKPGHLYDNYIQVFKENLRSFEILKKDLSSMLSFLESPVIRNLVVQNKNYDIDLILANDSELMSVLTAGASTNSAKFYNEYFLKKSCEFFFQDPQVLVGPGRTRDVIIHRQFLISFMVYNLNCTREVIGNLLNRDQSSITASLKTLQSDCSVDTHLSDKYVKFIKAMKDDYMYFKAVKFFKNK